MILHDDASLHTREAPASTVASGPAQPLQLEKVKGHRVDNYPAGMAASDLQLSALDAALMQFRATVMARSGEDAHAVAGRATKGSGRSLPHLDRIQKAFGRHDVSGVRTFTGAAADAASEALGARAFATGDAVVLGRDGQDLHTVAHEAAHVVQQRGGISLAGGVGRAGDRFEQHADSVADCVVRGQSAEALLDLYAPSPSSLPAQTRGLQRATETDQTASTASTATVSATPKSNNERQLKFMGVPIVFRSLKNGKGVEVQSPAMTIPAEEEKREQPIMEPIEFVLARLYGLPVAFAEIGCNLVRQISFQVAGGRTDTGKEGEGVTKHYFKATVTPTMGLKPYGKLIAGVKYEDTIVGALTGTLAWNIMASAPIEVGITHTSYEDGRQNDSTSIDAKGTAFSLDSFFTGNVAFESEILEKKVMLAEFTGEKVNYGQISLGKSFFASGEPEKKKPGARKLRQPLGNVDLTAHLSRGIGALGEVVGIESPESVRKRIAKEIGGINDYHAAFTKEKAALVKQGMPRMHAQNIASLRVQHVAFGSDKALMEKVNAELPAAEEDYKVTQMEARQAYDDVIARLSALTVRKERAEHLANMLANWYSHPDMSIVPAAGKFIKEPNAFKSQRTLTRINRYIDSEVEVAKKATAKRQDIEAAIHQDQMNSRRDSPEGDGGQLRPGTMKVYDEDELTDLATDAATRPGVDIEAGVQAVSDTHKSDALKESNDLLVDLYQNTWRPKVSELFHIARKLYELDTSTEEGAGPFATARDSTIEELGSMMRDAVNEEVGFLTAMGHEEPLADLGWRRNWEATAKTLLAYAYKQSYPGISFVGDKLLTAYVSKERGFSLGEPPDIFDEDGNVIIY